MSIRPKENAHRNSETKKIVAVNGKGKLRSFGSG